MDANPPRRNRKTQEQKSAETRELLLEATIEVLFKDGYARLTTTAVCEQAGLSRGAQVYHFPNKWTLVTRAVEHLARHRIAEIRDQSERVARSGDPVGAILDLLWTIFEGPLFFVALELWVAARTDPELQDSLFEMERRLGRATREAWHKPMQAHGFDSRAAADLVQLSVHLMRGMALQRILKADERERRRHLAVWKQVVRTVLETPRQAVSA